MDALVPYERRITTEGEILPPYPLIRDGRAYYYEPGGLSDFRDITPVDKLDEGVVD